MPNEKCQTSKSDVCAWGLDCFIRGKIVKCNTSLWLNTWPSRHLRQIALGSRWQQLAQAGSSGYGLAQAATGGHQPAQAGAAGQFFGRGRDGLALRQAGLPLPDDDGCEVVALGLTGGESIDGLVELADHLIGWQVAGIAQDVEHPVDAELFAGGVDSLEETVRGDDGKVAAVEGVAFGAFEVGLFHDCQWQAGGW